MARLRFEELQVVAESEVPRSVGKSEWLDLFERIEEGKALAIPDDKAPPSSIREALKRLKQSGRLPENYLFASRKQPDGKVISYVINSASESTSGHQPATRATHATNTKREVKKLANAEAIRKFIMNASNDYEHSLPEIQTKIYGKPLSSRYEAEEYHRTYNLVRKVRGQLEKELGGKFVEELHSDGSKVYRLRK